MGKKTVSFNKTGLQKLPNDKPVLYRIKSGGGDLNYVGVAKRGRVSHDGYPLAEWRPVDQSDSRVGRWVEIPIGCVSRRLEPTGAL